jgi:ABC-type Fe3+-hydroxamate transport system substrate-binding protein
MLNPHGIQGVLTSISILGDALNRQDRAREIVSQLRGRIQNVRTRSQHFQAIPVFVPVWYSPVISIGRRAFMTEIVEAAGAHSVTDDIAEEWPQVSLEAVVARAPQALVLKRDAKMTFDTLAQLPGWNQLPAIQNHRVYYTDERMELPSVVMFDAMEDLAKQLHP